MNPFAAIAQTAARIIFAAAYLAAHALPGTDRKRRQRAKFLAEKAKEKAQKNAPAAVAIAINGLFLVVLGSVTFRSESTFDPDAISATLDTEGFFAKPVLPEPPGGGGGGGGASIDAALAQAAPVATVNVAIPQEALMAITTVAPATFQVPTSVAAVTDLAAKAAATKPAGGTGGGQGGGNGTGIGTGNGSGQGTGTGSGTGSGVGNSHGAGIGKGTGDIVGNITTVITDNSGSMEVWEDLIGDELKPFRKAKASIVKGKRRSKSNASIEFMGSFQDFEAETMVALQRGQKVIVWITDLEDDWSGLDGYKFRILKNVPEESGRGVKTRNQLVIDTYARLEKALLSHGASLHILSLNAGPVPPLRALLEKVNGSFTVGGKTYAAPNYEGEVDGVRVMFYKPPNEIPTFKPLP